MKRRGVWPHPVLSVVLALGWLLLQQSLAVAQIVTALVLGWGLPRLVDGFLGERLVVRNWRTAAHLTLIVLWDIIVSNITVARIVLSPTSNPQPAWVPVPLDIRHPTAITLLATIITTTPGTVSCIVDEQRRMILVHALDCDDVAQMAAQIKQRYEKPLGEILG
ncbi:MAG TPA: Na+/H+ antiporter subunit E [Burkholderiaceae bacterium]|mgnify:FL=1|nr:Na+/H+ antiporter subunit E [Burkholderiaceae bacterium]HQZ07436.1 Na+/H+ antiporter subunit E [Burkholderiaceae bacterium]HRA62664.1 Na+/H+ antiporter subunit E [Burkholderiaceae bacterium]